LIIVSVVGEGRKLNGNPGKLRVSLLVCKLIELAAVHDRELVRAGMPRNGTRDTKGVIMNELLKGNFKPSRKVEVKNVEETLEQRFEREAKKRLGGSIAYVAKKKVLWDVKGE
jgi:hypothetical protein